MKWADSVAADRLIAAVSLDTVDGSGQTLATEASSGSAALGSGAFGKVGTYRYHGSAVAVKELKAGAKEESIGALSVLCQVIVSPLPSHPNPLTRRRVHLLRVLFTP